MDLAIFARPRDCQHQLPTNNKHPGEHPHYSICKCCKPHNTHHWDPDELQRHRTALNKISKIYNNPQLFTSIHGKRAYIPCIYLGLGTKIVAHVNYIFPIQLVFPDASTNAITVTHLIQTMLSTNQIFLSSEDHSSNLDYVRSWQDPYSADSQVDPKTYNGTDAIALFLLLWFSQPTMLMNLCSMFRFSVMITPYHILFSWLWHFCLLSAHSGSTAYIFFIVIYF